MTGPEPGRKGWFRTPAVDLVGYARSNVRPWERYGGPQQVQHRGMGQTRAKETLQGRVDLGQQALDLVRSCGGLFDQVVVEAAEHSQLGELFVGDLDGAQGLG